MKDEYKKLKDEYKKLKDKYKKKEEEYKKKEDEYKKKEDEYTKKEEEYKKKEDEYKKLESEYKKLEDEYKKLKDEYKKKEGEFNNKMKEFEFEPKSDKEYINFLKEKYQSTLKSEIDKLKITLTEKLEEKTKKLTGLYEERYEKRENDMNKKFNEMSEIIMKSGINNNNNENLKLSIKKDNDNNIDNNNDNNNEKNNKEEHKDNIDNIKNNIKNIIYSYECTNINNNMLELYLYKDSSEGKAKIILKNNGKENWPVNKTKLIFDEDSDIKSEDIILNPQKPNETNKYNIIIKQIENYDVGEYKSYLWFNVDGQNFGDKIIIAFKIAKKDQNNEVEENMDKIKEFLDNFGLTEGDYSNEMILEHLKKYNFDFNKTFNSLFD